MFDAPTAGILVFGAAAALAPEALLQRSAMLSAALAAIGLWPAAAESAAALRLRRSQRAGVDQARGRIGAALAYCVVIHVALFVAMPYLGGALQPEGATVPPADFPLYDRRAHALLLLALLVQYLQVLFSGPAVFALLHARIVGALLAAGLFMATHFLYVVAALRLGASSDPQPRTLLAARGLRLALFAELLYVLVATALQLRAQFGAHALPRQS